MNSTSPLPTVLPFVLRPLVVLLGGVMLLGCPAASEEPASVQEASGRDAVAKRLALAKEQEERLLATGRSRSGTVADPNKQDIQQLAFDTVSISPSEPRASDEKLRAASTLMPGATPFTEVEYQWFVAGKELKGYRRPTLGKQEGRWQTGETIEVIAIATDETGRTARSEPTAVVIGNTPPVITTDLRTMKYLSGARLKATDPDGDEVTWSVDGNPPGVSISKQGVVTVVNQRQDKDWSGEAVFVATDPYGARSEIHIPLTVNAAKDGRVEDAGTKETRTTSGIMSEADLNKAAEADAKRFENMSEAEINAELDRRDALKGK